MATNQAIETAAKRPHQPDAKWDAVVMDTLVPLPRRRLKARDILHQAGAKPGQILVRDYASPNDVGFDPDAFVDLAEGNVFTLVTGCRTSHEIPCDAPPKLAFVVDDRWEITIEPLQTGASLRGLLAVDDDVELLRDFESPRDDVIDGNERVEFADGPVFITARKTTITIIVNGQKKSVTKRKLSFEELVVIAYGSFETAPNIEYAITYERGPHANPEGTLVAGNSVKIREGMLFNVQRADKS